MSLATELIDVARQNPVVPGTLVAVVWSLNLRRRMKLLERAYKDNRVDEVKFLFRSPKK